MRGICETGIGSTPNQQCFSNHLQTRLPSLFSGNKNKNNFCPKKGFWLIFNLFLNRFLLIRHHITSNDYRLTIHTNFKKEYLSRFQLQNRSFASTGYPEDPENSFSRSRVKGFYTCSSRRYPKCANKTDDPYHFPALSWLLSRHHSESKTPSHPHHITIITQMSHRYPIDVP